VQALKAAVPEFIVAQSSTFQEQERLYRVDIEKFKRTLGIEAGRSTLTFMRPERRAEIAAEIEAEAAGLEDN
jgi:hypothetical protein